MKTVEDILNSPNANKIGWCIQIKMSPKIEHSKNSACDPSIKNKTFEEQITLNTEQLLKVYYRLFKRKAE